MLFKINTNKLKYQNGVAKVRKQAYVTGPFSAGPNSANFNSCADWDGQDGNVTTVGSNGGPSAYGTYDQSGQVYEWNDLNNTTGSSRGLRGGSWINIAYYLSSSSRSTFAPSAEYDSLGFRLSSRFVTLNPLNLPHFALVNDINNSNHSTGYGGVNYEYVIAQYLVTNCEYVEFLNAVAAIDTYNLYNTDMNIHARGGITRSGSSGSYTYSVKNNMGNKPVTYVSWFDCARYCNWLHNGKGNGSTESGAYTIPDGRTTGNAVPSNNDAKYHLPTENEWHKAAYYKGGGTNAGYWVYATQSDTDPTCVAADSNGNGPVASNYSC
jgi:formylglycine-generating enzyme required for sulfatase activity